MHIKIWAAIRLWVFAVAILFLWVVVLWELPQAKRSQAVETPVVKEKVLKFAAVGDFEYNDNTRAVLKTLAGAMADFTLALGDFSYDKSPSEQAWCDMVQDAVGETHPFQLVAGNHDVHENGNKHDLNKFASCLPNRQPSMVGVYGQQYYFDDSLVRVIAIAPDLVIDGRTYDYTPGTPDRLWLEDAIQNRKPNQWLVVAMHKNCYTAGEKKCEVGEELIDYLVKAKVDVVLQGHEHGYFRSHQLTLGDTCPSLKQLTPTCWREGQTGAGFKYGAGSVLAIAGTGGALLRNVDNTRPDSVLFQSKIGANSDPMYGPLVFTVTKKSLSAELVGTDGKVHDSFWVVR